MFIIEFNIMVIRLMLLLNVRKPYTQYPDSNQVVGVYAYPYRALPRLHFAILHPVIWSKQAMRFEISIIGNNNKTIFQ